MSVFIGGPLHAERMELEGEPIVWSMNMDGREYIYARADRVIVDSKTWIVPADCGRPENRDAYALVATI